MRFSPADSALTLVFCEVSYIQIFIKETQAVASDESRYGKLQFSAFTWAYLQNVGDATTVTINH